MNVMKAYKREALLDLFEPWGPHIKSVLNRDLRNSIGHGHATHNLESGRIEGPKLDLSYPEFVSKVASAIEVPLLLLEIVSISSYCPRLPWTVQTSSRQHSRASGALIPRLSAAPRRFRDSGRWLLPPKCLLGRQRVGRAITSDWSRNCGSLCTERWFNVSRKGRQPETRAAESNGRQ